MLDYPTLFPSDAIAEAMPLLTSGNYKNNVRTFHKDLINIEFYAAGMFLKDGPAPIGASLAVQHTDEQHNQLVSLRLLLKPLAAEMMTNLDPFSMFALITTIIQLIEKYLASRG